MDPADGLVHDSEMPEGNSKIYTNAFTTAEPEQDEQVIL